MGLGQATSGSIIHMNLHKPNNKLLMQNWSTFSARTNHEQTQTHKTHHDPNLGEATTFPFIVYNVFGHETNAQMSFCPKTSTTLEAHNFMCRPPIEVKFKTKL